MSSPCTEFTELLLELTYDELDESTTRRLLAHQQECSSCHTAYAQIMGVRKVAKAAQMPPIPPFLGDSILELARSTAASFARENQVSSPAPAVVPRHTPSLLERVQSFIFRPAVVGVGLAAAALLIAVISMKTRSFSTMLEPVGDAPFVDGMPATEQEILPAAPLQEDSTPDKNTTESTSSDTVAEPSPPKEEALAQIQKAGPGYKPMYQEANRKGSSSKSLVKERRSKKESIDDLMDVQLEKKKPTASTPKNPADLLESPVVVQNDSVGSGTSSGSYTPPTATPAAKAKKSSTRTSSSAGVPSGSKTAPQMAPSAELAANEMEDAAASPARANSTTDFDEGMAAYNRGDCASATRYFHSVIDGGNLAQGNAAVAIHYIAKCEKRTGRCGQALIQYQKLLTQYGGYAKRPEALYEAAACHSKLGHTSQAKTLLEELRSTPGWQSKADQELQKLE